MQKWIERQHSLKEGRQKRTPKRLLKIDRKARNTWRQLHSILRKSQTYCLPRPLTEKRRKLHLRMQTRIAKLLRRPSWRRNRRGLSLEVIYTNEKLLPRQIGTG